MTTRKAMLATLPLLALLCGTAAAQDAPGVDPGQVRMFERAPSVEELRQVVKPDVPIRTRGIEIVGAAGAGAAKRRPDMSQAGYAPAALPSAAPSAAPAALPSAPPAAAPVPAQPESEPVAAAAAMPEPPAPAAAAAQEAPGPGAFGFNIVFAFNSAEIPADYRRHLDAVGALMQQEPSISLLIEGHTDATGAEAYNDALSERRATAVRRYLVEAHGVAPRRLAAQGKGEHEPLVADPYDGANRRVQFARTR